MRNAIVRNPTPLARPDSIETAWWLVDADGQVLGRLAARIATILMGKHKTLYTPHVNTGDAVVVTNAAKVRTTGGKSAKKVYTHYSGYPSGLKRRTLGAMMDKNPVNVIKLAVRRMLPKNRLGKKMFSRLWVYKDAEHPHQAQQPVPWDKHWVKKRMGKQPAE
ncbi:MAG TPA: 50S ribosomal protein L13 [Planctomycetes bacterium]|nr:50S ribosomal protein L13 [Planctomycetota bacterium]